MNSAFGLSTSSTSLAMIRVLRISISTTRTMTPDSRSTKSPKMMMPEMRLLKIFCNPKPMPTPSAPPMMAREPRSKPMKLRPMSEPTIQIT